MVAIVTSRRKAKYLVRTTSTTVSLPEGGKGPVLLLRPYSHLPDDPCIGGHGKERGRNRGLCLLKRVSGFSWTPLCPGPHSHREAGGEGFGSPGCWQGNRGLLFLASDLLSQLGHKGARDLPHFSGEPPGAEGEGRGCSLAPSVPFPLRWPPAPPPCGSSPQYHRTASQEEPGPQDTASGEVPPEHLKDTCARGLTPAVLI